MNAKKILITNTVALNGGDAAILLALVETLLQAFGSETRIIVYDSKPEVAGRYYRKLEFRPLLYTRFGAGCPNRYFRFVLRQVGRLRFRLAFWLSLRGFRVAAPWLLTRDELEDLEHYSTADLVISTGGTYLVEKYNLASRIFDFHVALKLQRPLVLFTQSLGPFRKPVNRKAFRKVFRQAKLVLLRDENSLRHVRELVGDECNACVSADVAFAFADELVLDRAGQQALSKTSSWKVAISVRDWPYIKSLRGKDVMERYTTAIMAATSHLIKNYGAKVTFLSTCQGIPEYWQDDARVAEQIIQRLPNDIRCRVSLNGDFHQPGELVKLLQSYDFVIATRMHMAILALTAGVPVLPIAYEFKTCELFSRLGMETPIPDIKTMTAPDLVANLESFLRTFPEKRALFFQKVKDEGQRARKTAVLVREIL